MIPQHYHYSTRRDHKLATSFNVSTHSMTSLLFLHVSLLKSADFYCAPSTPFLSNLRLKSFCSQSFSIISKTQRTSRGNYNVKTIGPAQYADPREPHERHFCDLLADDIGWEFSNGMGRGGCKRECSRSHPELPGHTLPAAQAPAQKRRTGLGLALIPCATFKSLPGAALRAMAFFFCWVV